MNKSNPKMKNPVYCQKLTVQKSSCIAKNLKNNPFKATIKDAINCNNKTSFVKRTPFFLKLREIPIAPEIIHKEPIICIRERVSPKTKNART